MHSVDFHYSIAHEAKRCKQTMIPQGLEACRPPIVQVIVREAARDLAQEPAQAFQNPIKTPASCMIIHAAARSMRQFPSDGHLHVRVEPRLAQIVVVVDVGISKSEKSAAENATSLKRRKETINCCVSRLLAFSGIGVISRAASLSRPHNDCRPDRCRSIGQAEFLMPSAMFRMERLDVSPFNGNLVSSQSQRPPTLNTCSPHGLNLCLCPL